MFVVLMPLLAGRTVLITVAKMDDNAVSTAFLPRPRPTRIRL